MTNEPCRPEETKELIYNSLISIGQLRRNLERDGLGERKFRLVNQPVIGMTKVIFE